MKDTRQHERRGLPRRQLLHLGLGLSVLPLLAACGGGTPAQPTVAPAPAAPPAAAAAPTGASTTVPVATAAVASTKSTGAAVPAFVPSTTGPKPDFPALGPQYQNAFVTYPSNPVKALPAQAPGGGGTITAFMQAYRQPPVPLGENPWWQEVNRQLNVTLDMNVVPFADFTVKLATLMAGSDLPDLIHLPNGRNAAPNLPQFLQAQCADLTPYLAGDSIKDYPNLGAISTDAWRNTGMFSNLIYANPIARPAIGTVLFKVNELYDAEIGASYVPKNADDYKRVLDQLNRPNGGQWATASYGGNAFDIITYAAMFGAPNNWSLDAAGNLTKDFETEAFKAAVGYTRDLVAAGLFHPNSTTFNLVSARQEFVARKIAIRPEGWNPYIDFSRQGQRQNPKTTFGMIAPFAADGGKPVHHLGPGYVAATAIKKGSPDRVREILGLFNWLAAPFGSQEQLLLAYGIQDIHYTLDDSGNPLPTTRGTESGEIPFRYVAQHPPVIYDAIIPDYASTVHEAEKALIPLGIADPTLPYYSVFGASRGVTVNKAFMDGVADIIAARRPLGDFDQLLGEWRATGGDQIRREFLEQMRVAA